MAQPNSTTAGNQPVRGRGLDALFAGQPAAPAAASGINPDLAALLDNEVAAIASGGSSGPGATRPALARTVPWPAPAGTPPAAEQLPLDTIDVPSAGLPPVEDQAQPGQPEAASGSVVADPSIPDAAGARSWHAPDQASGPLAGVLQPASRPLPGKPQRIGAILIETGDERAGAAQTRARNHRAVLAPALPSEIGPIENVGFLAMPSPRQLTPEQRAAILASISPEWLKGLHNEINELYREVTTNFANPPANAEQMLQALHDARQTLIENPEEYVNAEFRTLEVKAMLQRTRESREDGRRYGYRILGYELTWAALLLAGLALAAPLTGLIGMLGGINRSVSADVFPFWGSMMWGGLGGVVGALYMLWWHVSRLQDFDGQHGMWFLVQPVMGMVLGGIMFLVLAGGLLIVQVDLTSPQAGAGARLLPYLLAVLGGFRQNFVYQQFDRLVALFTTGGVPSGATAGKNTVGGKGA